MKPTFSGLMVLVLVVYIDLVGLMATIMMMMLKRTTTTTLVMMIMTTTKIMVMTISMMMVMLAHIYGVGDVPTAGKTPLLSVILISLFVPAVLRL